MECRKVIVHAHKIIENILTAFIVTLSNSFYPVRTLVADRSGAKVT